MSPSGHAPSYSRSSLAWSLIFQHEEPQTTGPPTGPPPPATVPSRRVRFDLPEDNEASRRDDTPAPRPCPRPYAYLFFITRDTRANH